MGATQKDRKGFEGTSGQLYNEGTICLVNDSMDARGDDFSSMHGHTNGPH